MHDLYDNFEYSVELLMDKNFIDEKAFSTIAECLKITDNRMKYKLLNRLVAMDEPSRLEVAKAVKGLRKKER